MLKYDLESYFNILHKKQAKVFNSSSKCLSKYEWRQRELSVFIKVMIRLNISCWSMIWNHTSTFFMKSEGKSSIVAPNVFQSIQQGRESWLYSLRSPCWFCFSWWFTFSLFLIFNLRCLNNLISLGIVT